MSVLTGPTVRDDGAGNAVLVKHAVGAGRLRLHHEAQVLGAARMEGVVECVGLEEFGERCELRLRYLEATTLAELPPLPSSDLLDVLIGLGTTLAELHARGIRHGALGSDHVLLVQPRRPVLCGFGEATGPADQSQHPAAADLAALAALAAAELTRAEDAAAEAPQRRVCADALMAANSLAVAVASVPAGGEPLADWLTCMARIRSAAAHGQPMSAHAQHVAVGGFEPAAPLGAMGGPDDLRARLRAQVTSSDPADGASSDAAVGDSAVAGPARQPMPDRRRVAAYGAAAAALTVAAVIGWRALAGGDPTAAEPETLIPIAAAPAPAAQPALLRAEPAQADLGADVGGGSDAGAATGSIDGAGDDLAGPAPLTGAPNVAAPGGATLIYGTASHGCPEPTDAEAGPGPGGGSSGDDTRLDAPATSPDRATTLHRADTRGDGCPEPLYVEIPDAPDAVVTVRTDDGEWTVGARGDLVAVGDWDCDGRDTLAVLSPAVGIVSFFASWPGAGRAVGPTRVAHVPHGAAAVSVTETAVVSDDALAPGGPEDEAAGAACDELVIHYADLSLTLTLTEPAVGTALWLSGR